MPETVTVPTSYALFDTDRGRCGIAWTRDGIWATWLPGRSEGATRAAIRAVLPGAVEAAPTPTVAQVIRRVRDLLAGRSRDDLTDVVLDTTGVAEFDLRVHDAARRIPPGTTMTYGEVAAELGEPGAARAVGRALARNRFPIVVPCHRVVAAGGAPGGFSAPGGVTVKRALLDAELIGAFGTTGTLF